MVDTRQNTYVGIILLGWTFARVITYTLTIHRVTVGRVLLDVVSDTRCNTIIRVDVLIAEILGHSDVARALDRLKASGRIESDITVESWRASLMELYRSRRKFPDGEELPHYCEQVVFNIRAGQLWKNDQLQQLPVIITNCSSRMSR